MFLIATILTDAAFLDLCVRLARLEEKVGGLYWVIGAIAIPIMIGIVQNLLLSRRLKNGFGNKK